MRGAQSAANVLRPILAVNHEFGPKPIYRQPAIDNSDIVTHTCQGFEAFLVADARANIRIGWHWNAAVGVENPTDDKYVLFHPFPQMSFTGELTSRW
jgi:hypothetical protein